ncbi:hypothetical protein BP6252_06631 [Coleophoma cylindrospora]|uniref:Inclusion body clearance protein IML2 n=1 Tax=Coleophoma cylindrospora TaxID=1849047 RepID=A0A3D8RN62_9HELO|nr:hypothetical protein BP6252_06631 [Coleophoma cylindrospora]
MFSVRKSQSAASVPTHAAETEALADTLFAIESVFNNDITLAEEVLAKGHSSFHELGKALMVLLRSSLGFDGEASSNAAKFLADAEAKASVQRSRVEPPSNASESIFPAGSEYSVCQAEAQLAAAIVAVLSQRMTEYLRGLYKIRQAYMLFRGIADHESRRVRHEKLKESNLARTSAATILDDKTLAEDEAAKTRFDISTPNLTTVADTYTYTGTNLCFGALLVALSMVPSAFQQVLRVVGFRGNKDRGLALLWETSKFSNVHGALAALALLSFYNVLRSAGDILDGENYPKERCEALVDTMIKRYPQSVFWTLEEARMTACRRELGDAIQILSRPVDHPVKQLISLTLIEKSMYQMLHHDYQACSEGFIGCIALSKYSQALYYYNAASAMIELYRMAQTSDPARAEEYKKQATEYLHTAHHGVDVTTLFSTTLPFDAFVTRKINKWQARADQLGVDLVDAVGVSPMEEMIYYYGGHKWMQGSELEQSLAMISWSEKSPHWTTADVDERCILTLLKAVVHRWQGDLPTARSLLTGILKEDSKAFKGKLNDNWILPSAHYEMAIVSWTERDEPGNDQAVKVEECAQWLDKVSRWEKYELDARLSLKVKAAQDVVTTYRKKVKTRTKH